MVGVCFGCSRDVEGWILRDGMSFENLFEVGIDGFTEEEGMVKQLRKLFVEAEVVEQTRWTQRLK